MFIDKDSVKIDGISMGKYLIQVEFGYEKLWAKDTGRNNMVGDWSGTLVGIFPKLILSFRRLSRSELELLAPMFNRDEQTTQYHDPDFGRTVIMKTYTGNWSVVNKNIGVNEPFNLSFIAKKRRE